MAGDSADQNRKRPTVAAALVEDEKRPDEDDEKINAGAVQRRRVATSEREDRIARLVHHVRYEQATEYEPRVGWYTPYRFCMEDISCLDLDEESTIGLGQPLEDMTESDVDNLYGGVNVLSVKILKSDVGFPVNIYGTVLVRDEFDFKCNYIFRRDRNDYQLVKAQGEALTLTGPYRGPAMLDGLYFEINLKIRCDGEATDRHFSKGILQSVPSYRERTMRINHSSWLSELELAYTPVYFAVEAIIGLTVLKGPQKFFGNIKACTTEKPDDHAVLYDSEASGTDSTVGDDGSLALSRNLVVLRVDEELIVKICVYKGNSRYKKTTTVITLGHSDTSVDVNQGCYKLRLKIEWSGISESWALLRNDS
ncbi:hypothetical protein E2562_001378 [Oryza meyeriana var. granulata]|uniref:DUF6598 domain-containing protein n=1 Tax=Oryza meyeriana var. granulata TaxID=110450 RepID=A0A6G1DDB2_9ORYZ|nr:hypothetical protein E2562_001378 [Oryza meyeriana var. granulata]